MRGVLVKEGLYARREVGEGGKGTRGKGKRGRNECACMHGYVLFLVHRRRGESQPIRVPQTRARGHKQSVNNKL